MTCPKGVRPLIKKEAVGRAKPSVRPALNTGPSFKSRSSTGGLFLIIVLIDGRSIRNSTEIFEPVKEVISARRKEALQDVRGSKLLLRYVANCWSEVLQALRYSLRMKSRLEVEHFESGLLLHRPMYVQRRSENMDGSAS
ncbi:unnamed protein product [Calypogeia fissa]